MTPLPKVKLKSAVSFPATILDGVGIDVVKQNGSYQFNLDFGDFAPPIASLSDPAHQSALLWNQNTDSYALAPVSVLSALGGSALKATVSILDFGAVGDAVVQTSSLTVGAGSTALAATSMAFTSADVGKLITIPGAGASGGVLSTTIAGVTDATHVTLAAPALTALAASSQVLVYGTDNTLFIQNAINATPNFGTLYINPTPNNGYLIKQLGATGRALVVDHPINIKGGGNLSRLVTDGSMGTTIVGILALQNGYSWKGVTWEGFTLGLDTNLDPFSRYGNHGIYFDATVTPGGFQGINIRNLNIGESSGGYYSLVIDGVGTQGNRIDNNYIYGGILLDGVADSNQITNNRLLGWGPFGIRIRTPGAGKTLFAHNSVTLTGGVTFESGANALIDDNFFEELRAPQYQRNAFLDIGGGSAQTVLDAVITNNTFGNIISTTSLCILVGSNSSGTVIENNFLANNTARAVISNAGTGLLVGPNWYQSSATPITDTGTGTQSLLTTPYSASGGIVPIANGGTGNAKGVRLMFTGNTGAGTVGTGVTAYAGLSSMDAVETNVWLPIAFPGVFKNLAVVAAAGSPGAGHSWTVTLRKTLASTAITCVIPNGSNAASDLTHSVAFDPALNDRFAIQVVNSGAPATSIAWSIEFDPT